MDDVSSPARRDFSPSLTFRFQGSILDSRTSTQRCSLLPIAGSATSAEERRGVESAAVAKFREDDTRRIQYWFTQAYEAIAESIGSGLAGARFATDLSDFAE